MNTSNHYKPEQNNIPDLCDSFEENLEKSNKKIRESRGDNIQSDLIKQEITSQIIKKNDSREKEEIELSYKDINLRLHTKDEFFMFFHDLNQRLLPNISYITAEYFRQLLKGEKKCLTLLDSRDYYFPKAFFNHSLLSVDNLYKQCADNLFISQYLPNNCTDTHYMVKLLATLNIGKLIEIDKQICEEMKGQPEYIYLND